MGYLSSCNFCVFSYAMCECWLELPFIKSSSWVGKQIVEHEVVCTKICNSMFVRKVIRMTPQRNDGGGRNTVTNYIAIEASSSTTRGVA